MSTPTDARSLPSSRLCEKCLLFFELQLAFGLVFFQKFAQIRGSIEQPDPLLVIQGDGKASQTIHAHASLFAYAKLQRAGPPAGSTLLQLRYTRFQLFIARLGHVSSRWRFWDFNSVAIIHSPPLMVWPDSHTLVGRLPVIG